MQVAATPLSCTCTRNIGPPSWWLGAYFRCAVAHMSVYRCGGVPMNECPACQPQWTSVGGLCQLLQGALHSVQPHGRSPVLDVHCDHACRCVGDGRYAAERPQPMQVRAPPTSMGRNARVWFLYTVASAAGVENLVAMCAMPFGHNSVHHRLIAGLAGVVGTIQRMMQVVQGRSAQPHWAGVVSDRPLRCMRWGRGKASDSTWSTRSRQPTRHPPPSP
jgi:hypothetical protein